MESGHIIRMTNASDARDANIRARTAHSLTRSIMIERASRTSMTHAEIKTLGILAVPPARRRHVDSAHRHRHVAGVRSFALRSLSTRWRYVDTNRHSTACASSNERRHTDHNHHRVETATSRCLSDQERVGMQPRSASHSSLTLSCLRRRCSQRSPSSPTSLSLSSSRLLDPSPPAANAASHHPPSPFLPVVVELAAARQRLPALIRFTACPRPAGTTSTPTATALLALR
ncbi:hypothetical protein GALMADRAFT_148557 [Galerina marginata CBS 339.88]|uniref:Uncharacterized protein n=1 Tax=Galerina marginata (strain CBS 339.88) TaxID=685588 RepID=A0A067SCY4_GALM3|nr:hypothetical protein GALMADRAFT_148557 [Galerina marginata CBS 339.88]